MTVACQEPRQSPQCAALSTTCYVPAASSEAGRREQRVVMYTAARLGGVEWNRRSGRRGHREGGESRWGCPFAETMEQKETVRNMGG